MALRNIRSCPCQRLQSIVQRDKLVHSSQYLSTTFLYNNRSFCSSKVNRVFSNTNNYNSSGGTVSTKELEKFKSLSSEWWKSGGEYTALRSLNKLRVTLIREVLGRDRNKVQAGKPLSNLKILDVGCGGGILAEPLARLGAEVTAIDPLQENIEAAKAHIGDDKEFENLSYACTTIEEISSRKFEYFDLVVASEVLEHVENHSVFAEDCCRAIKPGGHLVITTINRTILSTLFIKYAAEYLFRIVPQNTHDEDKFIRPEEVVDMLRESGMVGMSFRGMLMNPFTYHWSWTDMLAMSYACHANKPLVRL